MDEQEKMLAVFKWAVSDMDLKQTDLMKILGIKQPTASMLLSGQRKIRPIHLKKIAARKGVEAINLIRMHDEWSSVLFKDDVKEKQQVIAKSTPENIIDPIVQEHEKLIRQFPDPAKGMEMNREAVELAKIDPSEIEEVIKFIKYRKSQAKTNQESTKKRTSNGEE